MKPKKWKCFHSLRFNKTFASCVILLVALVFVLSGAIVRQARQVAAQIDPNAVAVPIIMYHSILKDPAYAGNYVISPSLLENDLRWLKENGYTAVLPRELVDYVQNGVPLPEKPVVLSFDDGYYNNYLYAYPLIQQYDMKMVLAIIGIHTDKFSQVDENNAYYSHCTWEQIREMEDSGLVELANHTYNLHAYNEKRHGCSKNTWEAEGTYRQMLCEDVLKVQNRAKEQIGQAPITFVYPFGSYCKETKAIIQDLNFICTFSCKSGINAITRDPECLREMKRFLRPSGSSSEVYFGKILSEK